MGRYLVGQVALKQFGSGFPVATMFVNVTGSLLMGILIGWMASRGGTNEMKLFLATGFLGGFTTFSAFSLDVAVLWERADNLTFLFYTPSL